MTHGWPTLPLGEVIKLSQDEHRVVADLSYPNIGIYSFGRGVFEKSPIEGTATSARTLFRIRAKQFIYSRLFAFEGAYGLVPDEYDGYFVSNEFPAFDIDEERLCPEFLALQFKLPSTWKTLAARTVGMGDRRQRIKPDQLLGYAIPLPSLAEQRRIVAKIERLAARTEEALGLQRAISTEATALCRAVISPSTVIVSKQFALVSWPPYGSRTWMFKLIKSMTSLAYTALVEAFFTERRERDWIAVTRG